MKACIARIAPHRIGGREVSDGLRRETRDLAREIERATQYSRTYGFTEAKQAWPELVRIRTDQSPMIPRLSDSALSKSLTANR